MKKLWKTGIALSVLNLTLLIVHNQIQKKLREYTLNKELQIIQPGWKGNLKNDGEFVNFNEKDKQKTPIDIFKWKLLSTNPQEQEKKNDNFRLELIEGDDWIHSSEDMIVWLGHASFFIRLGGTTFITDPVFYDMFFIKRHVGIPCDVDKIKGIDYILLSHGHRDHFDKKTLNKLIEKNPNFEALIPLNTSFFFKKKGVKFQEAGWYQKYKINDKVEVFFMPAKHWNRRGLFDFNKTLWGSFIIRHKGTTIYFSGDTSMGDHFEEIAQIFPDIGYCLLPVGAYKPVNIMQDAHLSPQEAYEAFKILGGKTFIPMHFGTYDLGDEPLGEPQRVLEAYEDNKIQFLKVGEVVKLEHDGRLEGWKAEKVGDFKEVITDN